MITATAARRLLDYDPETGVLRWKVSRSRAVAGAVAGNQRSDGYFKVAINGKNYLAHRIAFLIFFGRWPTHGIDHVNGNPTDNRIANLRDIPHVLNCRNRKQARNNSSGVTGVDFCKRLRKWRVQIHINNGTKHIGLFTSFADAARVRKNAEKEYGFHSNHGRTTTGE